MYARRRADAEFLKGAFILFVTIAVRVLVSLVSEYNVPDLSLFKLIFGFGDSFLKISYVGMHRISFILADICTATVISTAGFDISIGAFLVVRDVVIISVC